MRPVAATAPAGAPPPSVSGSPQSNGRGPATLQPPPPPSSPRPSISPVARAPTLPPRPLPPPAPASSDLRLDLWVSLLQASATQFASAASSASAAASGAATRLQRLTSPPPLNFPAGPSGEQTLALLSDPLAFLKTSTERYGPLVGLLLGGERVVLVTGREEARQVLVEQAGSVYVKEGTAFFPGSSLAGNGLLVSDGAVWQRQRRLSNPAFRRAAVEAYAGAMVAATEDMLEGAWGRGGVRDVYADFNELTLQVTLEALFGFGADTDGRQRRAAAREQGAGSGAGSATTPGPASTSSSTSSASSTSSSSASSEDAQQIVAAVEKAFMFFTQRAATGFVIPEWLPTWDNLEFAAAVQQLDRVVYGMINRRRDELISVHGSVTAAACAVAAASSGNPVSCARPVPTDLLTGLLLSRDEDGSGMTDRALRDELMTLLVAGQETSAILLGWASALLAAHPEVQQAVVEEVLAVCGRTDVPDAQSVRQMPYLESVVLETLRLYSPAYMVGRCARVDAALGPYSLPAGTTVLVSPYVMHRDPDVWEEPEAFKPSRWHDLQRREGYQGAMSLMANLGPNGAYLPFGGGPRNCIGAGFAMMEAMLVLAAVLQRYSLELPAAAGAGAGADRGFPKPKPLITLRPEAAVLRITPRGGGR
ncbi:hypothetical protein HYH03_005761 [Edaphochlamys debaryana]|uniref:Cytochrome P450 n=1 Tax=Edaphochlamys debaryana TaxID=47281 RepID=A0A835YEJ9_9CHLO|nr:hypothetical protein HYH03_005761 [Edaphochlamys debaryana]|eukprot:KAG2496159.1 hypothetical protein HYH03_005761 [Edaphochlamys debaryana]